MRLKLYHHVERASPGMVVPTNCAEIGTKRPGGSKISRPAWTMVYRPSRLITGTIFRAATPRTTSEAR